MSQYINGIKMSASLMLDPNAILLKYANGEVVEIEYPSGNLPRAQWIATSVEAENIDIRITPSVDGGSFDVVYHPSLGNVAARVVKFLSSLHGR
jgi:hypothetical protein